MKLTLLAGVIGLGLLGQTPAEEPKPDQPAPQTFLFLGDSITRAGGYVRNIEAELAKLNPANPPKVINHGYVPLDSGLLMRQVFISRQGR